MRRYRSLFFLSLGSSMVLAGALAYVWFHPRGGAVSSPDNSSGRSPAAVQPAGPPAAEPKLVPVTLTPERIQSIGVKTGTVEYRQVFDEMETTGDVEVDERRLAEVQVRYSGWIQQVYADATYQHVRKGQRLLTIYSPELVTTENEYLLARQNRDALAASTVPGVASGASSLLSSAMERLKQWQIPEAELTELEQTGKVKRELEVDAPVSGYIVERKALPNMYVQPGTLLYSLADLSTVWVYAQVFQNDLGRIRLGSPAEITVDSYPGRVFRGRVSFIWPQLDQTTRTAKVRLEIQNPDLTLALGMFVNVRLDRPMGRQLVMPTSGVFQTGTRQVAFVNMGDGHYEPQEIEVGDKVGDDVVVIRGLKAGESIVTSANFLIDSESQLQAAMGAFAPPPPGAGTPLDAGGRQGQASMEYSSTPSMPRVGDNTFRVRLTSSGGAPVTGAQVTVTFFMPAMPAMGMAAMRSVFTLSDQGGGIYQGAGKVEMGGNWQVTLLATKNGQLLAQKQLSVNVGGM